MSEARAAALLPKLRFPEFRAAAPWKRVSLGEAASPVTEPVGQRKLTPVSISAGIGFVPQAEKFGRDISGSQYERYTVVSDGDFVYNKGNSLRFPEGCIYLLHGWGQVAAPNVFICFRLKDGFSNGFFQACFEANQHGRQLRQHITSGARSNGLLNISKEDFYSVRIPTPGSDEQQKIADCLNSLDDLIAAQARQVEAVRSHRSALIRLTFPDVGSAKPRCRFAPYRDRSNWTIRRLGELADNLDSQRVPIHAEAREAGDTPYYGASGVVDHVKGYIFDEDLLCVSEDGANLLSRTYPIAFSVSGKTWINNHAHVLRFAHACTRTFVEIYLNSIKLDDFITGVTQPKLNRAMLDAIPVPLPDLDEQEQVASTFAALDAIIAVCTLELEALRTHKQGLMQQLFPSTEAMGA